jgi:nucleotide-binding universal stress UspA family protein
MMEMPVYKHILVATDGSDVGERGFEQGLALAKALGGRVTVLTVTEPFPIYAGGDLGFPSSATMIATYGSDQSEAAEALLARARQSAEREGVDVETVHVADAQPAEAIIDVAKSRNCDLIAMGSHGRRGVGRLVLGSKTWEVVAHSEVPVLVVR